MAITARRSAFLALAGFILLAPAVPQVFGVSLPLFRPWTMYSNVGVGLLDGVFVITRADGRTERVDAREAIGFERYPRSMALGQPHQVLDAADLIRAARPLCYTLAPGETVGFSGAVQTGRRGWLRIEEARLCAR